MNLATQTIKMKIQFRRDVAANWEQYKHLIPADGEPCFVTDKNILKIGDGVRDFEHLPEIGGVSLAADDASLVCEEDVLKLFGFDEAEAGYQLRKGEDGKLEWFKPSTETVDGLQTTVTELETKVTEIREIVMPAEEGDGTLLDRVETLETKVDGVDAQIDAKITAFAENLTDDGKVNTLMELINYAEAHGKESAAMVKDLNNLNTLVGTVAVADQIAAAKEELEGTLLSKVAANAVFEHVEYEIAHKPAGTLVDYRDKEIRVMCPADTKFTLQSSGASADANSYYIGFKAYAPDGAVSFKEDLAEIISDNTMYTFDGNEFAGVDGFGRKYSIVWLPVAKYADGKWTYHGANSTKNKYIGWHYSVEWYDANGVKIDSDCIRINLSNEECHGAIEPYYMANVIKEVSVNGTLIEAVDGKIDIPVDAVVKSSDEIEVGADGTLSVKAISFNKIVQAEDEEVILNGGGAAG